MKFYELERSSLHAKVQEGLQPIPSASQRSICEEGQEAPSKEQDGS